MIGERRARLWLPAGLSSACAVLGWALYANLSAPIGEAAARGEAGGALIIQPLPAEAEFAMPELDAFRETLERPLFAPSRRPDAAPRAPSVAPQPIDLVLRGVILNGETRMALLVSTKDQSQLQIKLGERYGDWTLMEVEPNAVTFMRGAEKRTLAILFEEAPPKPAAPRAQPAAEPRGAARNAPAAVLPRAGQNPAAAPPQNAAPRGRAPTRTQQQIDAEPDAIMQPLAPER